MRRSHEKDVSDVQLCWCPTPWWWVCMRRRQITMLLSTRRWWIRFGRCCQRRETWFCLTDDFNLKLGILKDEKVRIDFMDTYAAEVERLPWRSWRKYQGETFLHRKRKFRNEHPHSERVCKDWRRCTCHSYLFEIRPHDGPSDLDTERLPSKLLNAWEKTQVRGRKRWGGNIWADVSTARGYRCHRVLKSRSKFAAHSGPELEMTEISRQDPELTAYSWAVSRWYETWAHFTLKRITK